jgi:hypothetical protein
MKIFYDRSSCINSHLTMYIHCTSAGDLNKVDSKTYADSEFDTVWTDKLNEWEEKEYFKWYNVERLAGHNTVIITYSFYEWTNTLIEEIEEYFDGQRSSGAYFVEYQSFNKN